MTQRIELTSYGSTHPLIIWTAKTRTSRRLPKGIRQMAGDGRSHEAGVERSPPLDVAGPAW